MTCRFTRRAYCHLILPINSSASSDSRDLVRTATLSPVSLPASSNFRMTSTLSSSLDSSAAWRKKTNILRVLSCSQQWDHNVRLTPSAAKYCSSQSLASWNWLELWERFFTNCGKNEMPTLLAVAIKSSRSPCGIRQFPAVSTSKRIWKVEEGNFWTNPSITEKHPSNQNT